MKRVLMVGAVLAAAAGCSLFGKRTHKAPPEAQNADVALNVANHNYLDVVIYLLHDGQRTRVGTVTGSSTAVFTLSMQFLGAGRTIQLLGDPIGSPDSALTEPIQVQPGQSIEWTLETDLHRSSVGVY